MSVYMKKMKNCRRTLYACHVLYRCCHHCVLAPAAAGVVAIVVHWHLQLHVLLGHWYQCLMGVVVVIVVVGGGDVVVVAHHGVVVAIVVGGED